MEYRLKRSRKCTSNVTWRRDGYTAVNGGTQLVIRIHMYSISVVHISRSRVGTDRMMLEKARSREDAEREASMKK
jgi:hypothetical protein